MPRSGGGNWAKEDYHDENYLYQHKYLLPATKSHGVKKAELEWLRRNAIDVGKKPCYVIEYEDRRWYMVLEEDFNCIPQAYDPE